MKRVNSILSLVCALALLGGLTSCTGLLVSSDFGYDDYGPSVYGPGYYGSPYGFGYNPPPPNYQPGWNGPVIAPAPVIPPSPPQGPNGANRPNYVPPTNDRPAQSQPQVRPSTSNSGVERPGNMGRPVQNVSSQPSNGGQTGGQTNGQTNGASGAHRVH